MPGDSQHAKINETEGRPMLTWVDEKPLTKVRAYPVQWVVRFDAGEVPAAGTNWSD